MKSRFDADAMHSNNWLRMHGFVMSRFCGKRKRMSMADYRSLPFAELFNRRYRHICRKNTNIR